MRHRNFDLLSFSFSSCLGHHQTARKYLNMPAFNKTSLRAVVTIAGEYQLLKWMRAVRASERQHGPQGSSFEFRTTK